MKQFLLPSSPDEDGKISITGQDFHYLSRVRRMKPGDTLETRDLNGKKFLATITSIGHDLLQATCTELDGSDSPGDTIQIHLAVCLPKPDKLDLIVRQAAETGVRSIRILVSEHSPVKLKAPDFSKRKARLESIIKNAVQQSGIPQIPELHELETLQNFLKTKTGKLFFMHTKPLEKDSLYRYLMGIDQECTLIIGPEGGLSGSEVELLQNSNALPVYFDTPIMRVETACVYSVAAFKTNLQILQSHGENL